MTYTEKQGYKPFNWNEFLNKTEITEYEWREARNLANKWVTCACGTQCDCIPRYKNGDPIDYKLGILGVDFYRKIKNEDKEEAKELLAKIEIRSSELIAEINLDISTK